MLKAMSPRSPDRGSIEARAPSPTLPAPPPRPRNLRIAAPLKRRAPRGVELVGDSSPRSPDPGSIVSVGRNTTCASSCRSAPARARCVSPSGCPLDELVRRRADMGGDLVIHNIRQHTLHQAPWRVSPGLLEDVVSGCSMQHALPREPDPFVGPAVMRVAGEKDLPRCG